MPMLMVDCRGFYRSSTGKWYIPDAVKCSAESKKDSRSGGMRSELKAGADGGFQLSFDIPAQLSPLFLAFELQIGARAELSRSGQRFAVPLGMSAGKITRMGEHQYAPQAAAWHLASTPAVLVMSQRASLMHIVHRPRGGLKLDCGALTAPHNTACAEGNRRAGV